MRRGSKEKDCDSESSSTVSDSEDSIYGWVQAFRQWCDRRDRGLSRNWIIVPHQEISLVMEIRWVGWWRGKEQLIATASKVMRARRGIAFGTEWMKGVRIKKPSALGRGFL